MLAADVLPAHPPSLFLGLPAGAEALLNYLRGGLTPWVPLHGCSSLPPSVIPTVPHSAHHPAEVCIICSPNAAFPWLRISGALPFPGDELQTHVSAWPTRPCKILLSSSLSSLIAHTPPVSLTLTSPTFYFSGEKSSGPLHRPHYIFPLNSVVTRLQVKLQAFLDATPTPPSLGQAPCYVSLKYHQTLPSQSYPFAVNNIVII